MTPKRIVIVFKPVGGSAKSGRVNEAKQLLSANAEVTLLPTTAAPGSATKLTREALAQFAAQSVAVQPFHSLSTQRIQR